MLSEPGSAKCPAQIINIKRVFSFEVVLICCLLENLTAIAIVRRRVEHMSGD